MKNPLFLKTSKHMSVVRTLLLMTFINPSLDYIYGHNESNVQYKSVSQNEYGVNEFVGGMIFHPMIFHFAV